MINSRRFNSVTLVVEFLIDYIIVPEIAEISVKIIYGLDQGGPVFGTYHFGKNDRIESGLKELFLDPVEFYFRFHGGCERMLKEVDTSHCSRFSILFKNRCHFRFEYTSRIRIWSHSDNQDLIGFKYGTVRTLPLFDQPSSGTTGKEDQYCCYSVQVFHNHCKAGDETSSPA